MRNKFTTAAFLYPMLLLWFVTIIQVAATGDCSSRNVIEPQQRQQRIILQQQNHHQQKEKQERRRNKSILVPEGPTPVLVASASSSSSTNDVFPISRSVLRRRYVMSLRRKNREKKSLKLAARKNKPVASPGTKFTFEKPTPDKVDRWFSCDFSTALYHGANPIQFNHDCVGMTNPCIRIATRKDRSSNNNNGVNQNDNGIRDSLRVIPASNNRQYNNPLLSTDTTITDTAAAGDGGDEWWPETSLDPATTMSSESSSSSWRIIRLRCRVGTGQKCYQQVRDALLDWQFDSTSTKDGKEQGIMRVHQTQQQPNNKKGIWPPWGGQRQRPQHSLLYRRRPSYDVLPHHQQDYYDDTGGNKAALSPFNERVSSNIQQIWSGPHMFHRLVTYTTSSFGPKWLPKLYAINPVMVIYDLVDQRGQGTTYTSTAYATLKGHLLSGEERATVAIRDGRHPSEEHVDIEILSFSRPSPTLQGHLIWPVIGKMQKQFFLNQLETLRNIGAAAAAETTETEASPNQKEKEEANK